MFRKLSVLCRVSKIQPKGWVPARPYRNSPFRVIRSLIILCALIYFGVIVSAVPAAEIESLATDLKSQDVFFSILGPKDVLQINVANHPEFSGKVTVATDGTIALPLTGDSIRVDGLTKDEAAWEVTRVMSKYVKTPRVAVDVVDYNSKVYYVFGEVSRPGKFPMADSVITLRDALIESGFHQKTAALGRVHVVTPDPEHPACRVIDAAKIIYKGKLRNDVVLKPGDVVYVPNTVLDKTSFVLGQILSPLQRSRSITDSAEGW